jgi:hypothetical protein
MDTYDPAAVKLVIGGNIISDFMDGTFVTVAKSEDDWLGMVGADGNPARAKNLNDEAVITFTLKQTSRSNLVLSSMRATDRLTRATIGASSVTDALSTTTISGESSYIKKVADVGYAKEIQGREWQVALPRAVITVGGSIGIPGVV